MKTNSTYILFISMLLCATAIAGVLYMNIQMDKKIETIRGYVTQQKQNNSLEFGQKLDDQTLAVKSFKDKISQTFLHVSDLVGFIETLEQIAQELNIELTTDKFEPKPFEVVSDAFKVQDVRFNLNLNGSYDDIRLFLERLSSFENEIFIEEFKLYKTKKEDQIVYNARMVILTKVAEYDKK